MCDTFIALSPATADGSVVFGKNSDRPAGEPQSVRFCAGANHPPGASLRCTYIDIPQVPHTHSALLSQIDWMWGAEMGANERGVVIGNEAVWTREPMGPPALLGMDLVRLGLERGDTAQGALETMTGLLERHGQGGACAENDPSFTYHNAFLIADATEAWVLETAGKHWVAERIGAGTRNISNGLTIRSGFHRCSAGLVDHARRRGLYDGVGAFDFAEAFSATPPDSSPHSRQACGSRLLTQAHGQMTAQAMMEILRDHESGICMHGPFETTASMVSCISGPDEATHWFAERPHPCRSAFRQHRMATDRDAPTATGSRSPARGADAPLSHGRVVS